MWQFDQRKFKWHTEAIGFVASDGQFVRSDPRVNIMQTRPDGGPGSAAMVAGPIDSDIAEHIVKLHNDSLDGDAAILRERQRCLQAVLDEQEFPDPMGDDLFNNMMKLLDGSRALSDGAAKEVVMEWLRTAVRATKRGIGERIAGENKNSGEANAEAQT